jgi:hypothetical protein
VTLQTQALANVCLSMPDDELRRVRKQLEQLVEQMPDLAQRASSEQPSPRAVQDWALRVMAANERATRALGQYVDRLSELLGCRVETAWRSLRRRSLDHRAVCRRGDPRPAAFRAFSDAQAR